MLVSKIMYVNASISKILAAGLESETTIIGLLYFRDFSLFTPPLIIL